MNKKIKRVLTHFTKVYNGLDADGQQGMLDIFGAFLIYCADPEHFEENYYGKEPPCEA